jgi:hypothetical protein
LLIAEVAGMRAKFVVCLSVIVLLSALVAGCGTGGGGLSLPIKIENADHVGAIALNLLYDSAILEVTAVTVGALARGSTASWAIEGPGQLKVVVLNAKYMNGDGTLVAVKCRVLNSAGSSTLVVRVLEARSADTGEVVETHVTEGNFTASDESVEAPVISFGA